jgi:sugar lactone lactonase YvrE
VRRLRILCALVVAIFAALALSIALENPATNANAQSQSQTQSASTMSTTPAAPPSIAPAASNGITPTIVASNIGVRTLTAAQQTNETLARLNSASTTAAASSPEQLFVTTADKPDQVFSFLVPVGSPSAATAASGAAKLMAAIAGVGTIGSVGDGGAAISAQLDLNATDITVRSGVAVAGDGTVYISDTGNRTIRMVASTASSEPGIIRSIAGRWAPRQNVELSEPMGIALDRAGDLYIADYAANAIAVLYGASSPKAGQLETLAHMVAPGSVAVTLDGGTVFASSPQTGVILAINTQSREVRAPAINPAKLFAAAQKGTNSPHLTPTGLAVDGGGNLFIAYSDPGASYDEILRLDAFSAKVTLAARGLSSPGDISFDARGDLFVANQGMRNVVRFNLLGAAATGVILTPPVGTCTDSDTIFCDQLIGGTSATQSFELTNNTANALSGITASFLTGDTGDFAVTNSSCSSSLAANSSCAFNVAFTPTANASPFQSNDGVTCGSSATTNSRCSVLTVNYSGAATPVTAAATGIGDDFQIACVVSTSTSCVDLPDSNFDQTTIVQGDFATFQLEIVPDNTFSGTVNLICPTGLPVSPAGTVGNPTTCGLSLGTSVTEPLQSSLSVQVVAGTPLMFNMTIQTTTTKGLQTLPTAPTPPSSMHSFSRAALLAGLANSDRGGDSGPSAGVSATQESTVGAQLIRSVIFLFVCWLFIFALTRRETLMRRYLTASALALALIVITVAGCGGSSNKTATVIPFTPTGTYMLTVHGSAQNGARGYTCTLIVAAQ